MECVRIFGFLLLLELGFQLPYSLIVNVSRKGAQLIEERSEKGGTSRRQFAIKFIQQIGGGNLAGIDATKSDEGTNIFHHAIVVDTGGEL